MSVVRVHLADDHTLFREGLASLLAASEGVEVLDKSPTGERVRHGSHADNRGGDRGGFAPSASPSRARQGLGPTRGIVGRQ